MDFKIAVLAGDGIGPEISVQGVDVMNAVCEKFGHKVSYKYAICGADAIDKVGDPFPEATYEICKDADAVLFSAEVTLSLIITQRQRYARSKGCWLCGRNWDCLLTSVRYKPLNVWFINRHCVQSW